LSANVTAPLRRVLIDGRSGSGKTELARAVVAGWVGELAPQLVRLDDLYPGWDGLDAGSAAVPEIIAAHRWQAWDWERGAPGAWHELDPARPVVIEGVGAISRESKPLADAAIWVTLDDDTRKARALARDGDTFAPHWDRWARHELDFIEREGPETLADLVIDGRSAERAWLTAQAALFGGAHE
jgi:uridine kinase